MFRFAPILLIVVSTFGYCGNDFFGIGVGQGYYLSACTIDSYSCRNNAYIANLNYTRSINEQYRFNSYIESRSITKAKYKDGSAYIGESYSAGLDARFRIANLNTLNFYSGFGVVYSYAKVENENERLKQKISEEINMDLVISVDKEITRNWSLYSDARYVFNVGNGQTGMSDVVEFFFGARYKVGR